MRSISQHKSFIEVFFREILYKMESWQRDYITKNLPELIELTNFSTTVKASLLANRIFSRSDVEELNAQGRNHGKLEEAKVGYDILQTRTGTYDALINALEESCQTGALKVLITGKRNRAALQEQVPQQELDVQPPPNPVSNTRLEMPTFSASNKLQALRISPSTCIPVDRQQSIQSSFFANTEVSPNLNFILPTPTFRENDLIKYSKSDKLRSGSGGTFVFKGTYAQRDVAVKILSNLKNRLQAKNEIDILSKCDTHENIIQYYNSAISPNGVVIALELCKFTLADWVENPNRLPIQLEPLEALKQATQGLGFLHSPTINIIHTDLKPSNILFSIQGNKVRVKISDFGISRTIDQGETKRACASSGGAFGWKSPEILEAESVLRLENPTTLPKLTKKVNIFSLGCVYYFVLTKGDHPFGVDEDYKNHHIKDINSQLKKQCNSLRLHCNLSLVDLMMAWDPRVRPNIEYILTHPIYFGIIKK